ncbi:hypothetical protein pb186bvf_009636 [Paramecium bursaria]
MINLNEYQGLFKECFLYFPSGKLYNKTQGDEIIINSKLPIRKFFDGQIEFQKWELDMLMEFKKLLNKQYSDNVLMRMLYATKFQFNKTLQILEANDVWRSQPKDMTQDVIKYLFNGAIYVHGRDHFFRPIIIVNATKLIGDIDLTLQSLTVFLEYLLDKWMLPGQIENWITVLDLGGLGIAKLPAQQLQKLMTYLSNNYRQRMYRCYVVNCNKTLTLSWSMIKGFLDETTVKKISFYNNQTPQPLFEHTHCSQVEIKYGGSSIDKTEYWPPRTVSDTYHITKINLISEDQYKQNYEQGKLKNNKVCQELIVSQGSDDSFQSCD